MKHILNLGAGVQSTTLYLMFMQGELGIELDCAIFADTGEEPKAVYRHLEWLQSLQGPPILVRSVGKLGDDLKVGRNSTGGRFASIPAHTAATEGSDERAMTRRQCSKEYKIEVIEKTIRYEVLWLKRRQRLPKNEMTQYVGISVDEAGRFERLKRRRPGIFRAPLIERHMLRNDCVDWLRERGKVPHEVPRSACVFCPFHSDAEWMRVKSVPEDWERAVEIDNALRVKGNVLNRNMEQLMYVHRSCRPLVQIEFRKPVSSTQGTFGFWRQSGFNRECLGVCGL